MAINFVDQHNNTLEGKGGPFEYKFNAHVEWVTTVCLVEQGQEDQYCNLMAILPHLGQVQNSTCFCPKKIMSTILTPNHINHSYNRTYQLGSFQIKFIYHVFETSRF